MVSVCNKRGSPLDHDSVQAWSSWRAVETGSAKTVNGLNRGLASKCDSRGWSLFKKNSPSIPNFDSGSIKEGQGKISVEPQSTLELSFSLRGNLSFSPLSTFNIQCRTITPFLTLEWSTENLKRITSIEGQIPFMLATVLLLFYWKRYYF